jgi:hypothetical protein
MRAWMKSSTLDAFPSTRGDHCFAQITPERKERKTISIITNNPIRSSNAVLLSEGVALLGWWKMLLL